MNESSQNPAENQDAPGGEAPPEPRRPAIGWRILRWLGGTVLVLLLVVFGLLFYLLGTQSGLRTAFALADRFVPGMLSVGVAEGRVLGRLHLEDLALHLPTTDVGVGAFDLNWSPGAIFSGVLSVEQLAARDIDVTLGPSPEKEKEPFSLPNIVIPFRFDVGEASVDRLRILEQGADAPLFALEHAALSANLVGSELQVASLEALLEQPQLAANAKGRANLTGDYPLGLDLDWQLDLPPDAKLAGKGKISGDLQRLAVEHSLRGSVDADLKAQVRDVLGRPAWDGSFAVLKVDLPAFQSDLPAVETGAKLETRGDLDQATLVGTLDARAPNLPDFGHLALALDLLWKEKRLTINRLDMTEQVSKASLDAKGELDLNPQPGRFSIKGDWKQLRWPLSGDLLAQSPEGKVDASGSFEDFVYALDALAQGPSFPSAKIAAKGRGSAQNTQLDVLRVETLDGVLEAGGTLAWAPELGWDFKLHGKDLNPGSFVEGLDDRIALNLQTKGALAQFDYDLVTTTQGPGLPPASLTLIGAGDLKQTQVETLKLDILDGRIQGQAKVDLAPKIGWDAALSIAGINPGSYAPEWPGRIDGRLSSQGTLEESGPNLTAVIEQLKGTLRGYPIAAAGKVAVAGKQVRLDGVTAESGPSKLRVDGEIADALDLSFALASPDLASVLPEAKGSLDVQGKVRGALDAPDVKLDLRARDVEFAGNGIASLTGDADVGLGSDGRFAVRLDGKDLAAGGLRWNQLAVRGDGSLPNHQLSVSLTGEQLSTKVALSGGLTDAGGYKGQLTTLDLSAPDAGAWRLQRAAPFAAEPPKIAAGPLCLRHAKGSGGCVDFDQSKAGQWTANVDLDKLDFALLEPFLPANLTAKGLGRIKGRFTAQGATLTGGATAEIPEGVLSLDLGKGQREKLDFSSARLRVDAKGGGLSASLGLPLKAIGEVRGELSLPGWRLDDPARPDQSLRGNLRAKVDNLSLIANMAPQLSGLSGGMNADLTLGGTLARPGVKGLAEIKGVGFQIPLIALDVKDVNLSAKAPTMERMTIQGGGLIGGGRLDIKGDAGFGQQGFKAEIKIAGDKLKVANTKEYFALVSPKIDIQADTTGASIRGEIRIPEARIRPRSVPSGTVSPSADVTMEAKEPAPPYPLSIDLRVVMGRDVTIDAFGVRGRLGGNLAILQAPGKDMLGDGQLQITDGEYRLSGGFGIAAELGPPLKITQGRLVYAKSPIDNPGLLLQAERDGGDTTAGVRVLGTLRDPKLAFFSESDPGMTQAEITKYLMTGIPPSGSDKNDEAGLAVGTYVAPKIYMEYESGLGDEANKVKLRYDLSRHIELQTETGDSQGADIYFKFEN
ncbi:translocation/assembly module TamB domain-containing protein [Thiocystis violacea]|uniref:translocation/assembly module TamB domain-containing protein n=1 Tax=Thiocystis violacea TaxID=13725 RepID=UPI001F5B0A9F|nr:translocation/assembly module TamB domain-containing protein [Thiocystis violacea]MBK1723394.1 translocation/assembly module TamB [Thiocystis violacea]